MQRLLTTPGIRHSRVLLAQNEDPAEAARKEAEKKKKEKEEEEKRKETPPPPPEPHPVDFFGHFDFYSGSGDEAALVVFAVVGLILIVAWVPYFPVLLYQAAKGDREVERIHQLSLQEVLMDGGGTFSAARYSLYLRDPNQKEEPWGTLGLSLESGYYRFRHHGFLDGGYWLMGPSMHFGEIKPLELPVYAKIDLLAGTSFDSDLGLISRADFTVGYIFDSAVNLGLGIGGLYLHTKHGQGVFVNRDRLDLIYNFTLGYTF